MPRQRDELSVRSEVFLREDILAILQAIAVTNKAMTVAPGNEETSVFNQGFVSALIAVATACHIDWRDL